MTKRSLAPLLLSLGLLTLDAAASPVSRQIPGPDGRPVSGVGLFVAVDPAPGRPGLSGRVFDPGGTPLVEAFVSVLSDSPGSGGTIHGTRSQEDGSFLLSPLPPGPVTLKVAASGYESAERQVDPASGSVRLVAVLPREDSRTCGKPAEPEPIPSPAAVAGQVPGTKSAFPPRIARGRVVGPNGAPVEGARVEGNRGGQALSAADGWFELPVPAFGLEGIKVLKPGFAAGWSLLETGPAPLKTVEIRLSPDAAVTGRVLGLAGASLGGTERVTLHGYGGLVLSAALRSDGTFRLENVPPGTWEVSTRVSRRNLSTFVTLREGQTEVRADLQLPPKRRVSGRVRDALGRPLDAADVLVQWHDDGEASVRTGRDGRFTLDLPDDHYSLTIQKDGYQDHWLHLQVQGAPIAGLSFRLERATHLRGHLLGLDRGEKPEVKAQRLPPSRWPGSSRTELGLGEYSIPDLRPGLWMIEARSSRCTVRRTIEIPAGATLMEVDLDFGGGLKAIPFA